jgi:hypothetical protein
MENKINATHSVILGSKQISKILNDKSPKVSQDIDRFMKALNYIVECYYGLKFDKLNSDLFRLTTVKVMEMYPHFSFVDLDLAYSDVIIEKRQGTTLTRDELLKPINEYHRKKTIVLHEAQKVEAEVIKKMASEKLEAEFLDHSIQIYNEDLKNKELEYSGTVFQASTFAKSQFSERFTQTEKNRIFDLAKKQYNLAMKDFENNPDVIKLPPPHVNFIFAKLVVDHALINGYAISELQQLINKK